MEYELNPFQELYVSDRLSAAHFVELFSPVPLQSVLHPLFQGSTVVLVGTQGCGKTMLLNLLKPEIIEAFARHPTIQPPIGKDSSRFISAGVNLLDHAISDIAEISLGEGVEKDLQHLPLYFADFFNYMVVEDLLRNLRTIGGKCNVFGDLVSLSKLEGSFVDAISRESCWFGALKGCATLDMIIEAIGSRITVYRSWVTLNRRQKGAPAELAETKTAIGEPILRSVKCLKECGVIADIPVFIRVDQLENLHQEADESGTALRTAFRQILNRAFGSRDQGVVYRIGTRRYGWDRPEHLKMSGSGAPLEERRDYLRIDMDELFRRKEREKNPVFPQFAADAFNRRLKHFFKLRDIPDSKLPKVAFGASPKPRELAAHFMRRAETGESFPRVLGLDAPGEMEKWSSEWLVWLKEIYANDPLDAILAAAWGRQSGGKSATREHRDEPPPVGREWQKIWWLKERLQQAVLQLAARRQQRLLWWGWSDILSLSRPNISAFIHICHEVWDQFLKEEREKPRSERVDVLMGGTIAWRTQAAGIQSASAVWHRKLGEQPGGDVRRRFIDSLGKGFRRQLRNDKAMSYPGANGFSMERGALEVKRYPNKELWHFLQEAVSYGDLFESEHRTKNKTGERRLKFYLNPILSPVFQIPEAHTKEPLYWTIEAVMKLCAEAELPFAIHFQRLAAEDARGISKSSDDPQQLGLF